MIATDKVEEVIKALDGITKNRYIELTRLYARETRVMSMLIQGHRALVELMGMGEAIVPWLLEDLDSYNFGPGRIGEFDPWAHFWLLRTLTSESPVIREKDRGRLSRIQGAWVDWGKKKGLI